MIGTGDVESRLLTEDYLVQDGKAEEDTGCSILDQRAVKPLFEFRMPK